MAARMTYATAPGRTDDAKMRNLEWAYAQEWAGQLSAAELRAAAELRIPGDAGLAVEQEQGRRA